MPIGDENETPGEAAIDPAHLGSGARQDSPAPELPALAPDSGEEERGDKLDNVMPTYGCNQLPVVALGGSAGGIQALKSFFAALPPGTTGAAYVVILHLSPEHVSTLPELLQSATSLPVKAAEDSERLQADHVYVIPPGKHLTMTDGHLRLSPLEPERGKRVVVDLFFRSLADAHGPHAAAIVLSGADSDGAIGIKRVKERGGLTIAQEPGEAEHEGMPRAAIVTGMVDWVLPVADMPARLLRYRSNGSRLRLPPEEGPQPAKPAPPTPDQDERALREVLLFLRTRTGSDFTYYKRATILRRVARRMQINEVTTLPAYLDFLRMHPGEAGALLQDLLVSVTNFFRDREAFAALEARIPSLFINKGPNDTVRVWTAACATGEEAYSMAMLLSEHARRLEHPPMIQVFGCDLDEQAVQTARAGLYPFTIAADVSEERLAHFFVKDMRGYQVRRELRETVLFAQHDLLKDAPFSRVDLLSCRNLLIYLDREAQARALEVFHFAIKPDGLLFLGSAESVDEQKGLFDPIDKKHCLFVRRATPRAALPVPIGTGTLLRAIQAQTREAPATPRPTSVPGASLALVPPRLSTSEEKAELSELHLKLVERYAPPSLIVNEAGDIVHLSASVGRFLRSPGGQPTTSLLQTVLPALRMDLRAALLRLQETHAPVEIPGVLVELEEGVSKVVDLRVAPADELAPGCVLVSFAARAPDAAAAILPGAVPMSADAETVVRHLERELEVARARLRDTVEHSQANEEEYKSSNEELQSMNEELRSASEELETSREELQSLNEELTTVNSELKHNVEEVGHANSDLHNLMNATSIVTVFLDRELKVTRYTPNAAELFFLIPTDVGRPLEHVKLRLDYPGLLPDVQQVLRTLVPIEREVDGTDDQRWFLVRLQPYRTTEDRIGGVVLTFVDITERRRAETARRESEEEFRSFLAATSATVYKMSADWGEMRYLEGRRFLADTRSPSRTWLETYIPPDDQPTVLTAIQTAIDGKHPFELEHRIIRADGTVGWTFSRAVPLLDERGEIREWMGAATDVTERKRGEEALRASNERSRIIVESAHTNAIFTLDSKRTITSWNPGAKNIFGWLAAEIIGQSIYRLLPPEMEEANSMQPQEEEAVREGRCECEEWFVRRDGSQFWGSGVLTLLPDHGHVTGFLKIMRDRTDELQARQAREEVERERARLRLEVEQVARRVAEEANAAKDHFLAVLSHELRTPLMPINMALAMLNRRQDLPEAVREVHEMIKRNVELEALFIADLLDVTRISRGKIEIVPAPMNLHEALERAVEVSSPDIEAKGQRLAVHLEAGDHRLSGDFVRLQQVAWNLLKNASKFTPEGGAITLRSRNDEPGRVVVEVTDTGIGMEAEALARVFQPFEQANVSITREFGGLGLGLAIAKSSVEAHGGTLTASSPGPGQGATFTFVLPLTSPQATA